MILIGRQKIALKGNRKEKMQKYMSHPKHGRMPVYSDAEIAFNKKNGWIEETQEVVTFQQSTKTNVPEVIEKPRRGRKPGVKYGNSSDDHK